MIYVLVGTFASIRESVRCVFDPYSTLAPVPDLTCSEITIVSFACGWNTESCLLLCECTWRQHNSSRFFISCFISIYLNCNSQISAGSHLFKSLFKESHFCSLSTPSSRFRFLFVPWMETKAHIWINRTWVCMQPWQLTAPSMLLFTHPAAGVITLYRKALEHQEPHFKLFSSHFWDFWILLPSDLEKLKFPDLTG